MGKKDKRKRRGKTRRASFNPLQVMADRLSPLVPGDGDDSPTPFQDKRFDCFLCNRSVDIRLSKKGRPYFICDDCGIQVFVRGDKGIKCLAKRVQDEDS